MNESDRLNKRAPKILYFLLLSLLIVFLYLSYQIYIDQQKELKVIFLDVGQGDSILIAQGTFQILIDGGPSGKTELAKVGQYLPFFDRTIEIVVLTHPDKDHLAGLVEIARNYQLGKVLQTGAEKDTATYEEWLDVLRSSNVPVALVQRGDSIDYGDLKLNVLGPEFAVNPEAGDANNSSIIVRLDFGENSFLFTGDIESEAEKALVASGENIDVDFLKVAHHGSRHSSIEDFLRMTSPRDAVISVGSRNTYGHPTPETLARLQDLGINILRTDELGDILYRCPAPQEECTIEQ